MSVVRRLLSYLLGERDLLWDKPNLIGEPSVKLVNKLSSGRHHIEMCVRPNLG